MKLILLILLTIITFIAIIFAYIAFGTKENGIYFILLAFLSGYWASFFIAYTTVKDASKTNNA